jgi:hypothetical protein
MHMGMLTFHMRMHSYPQRNVLSALRFFSPVSASSSDSSSQIPAIPLVPRRSFGDAAASLIAGFSPLPFFLPDDHGGRRRNVQNLPGDFANLRLQGFRLVASRRESPHFSLRL